MLRIIHTADWHLGKMLDERSREPEQQMFVDFLLTQIVEEKIDALLLSGDVFDSANPPQSALACYYQFLAQLRALSPCRVIIIAGNHDSPALLEAPRAILQNLDVHVVGRIEKPTLIALPNEHHPLALVAAVPFLRDADLRIGSSGQSSAEIQQQLNDGIARVYEEHFTTSELPVIAMGHLTVAGSASSDSEREIHIGGLGALPANRFPSGFCYIALGHLHRPQACGGNETIRYSGSPIALSFSEASDKKQLRLIEIDTAGLLTQRAIAIPDFRRLIRISADDTNPLAWHSAISQQQQNRPSALPAWVEVRLTKTHADVEIRNATSELAAFKEYEILRVLQPTNQLSESSWTDTFSTAETVNTLADPNWMFEKKLEAASKLDDSQKELLRTLFASLQEIHHQPKLD